MFHNIFEALKFSVTVVRERLVYFCGLASIALMLDVMAEFYLGRFALLAQLVVTITALRLVTRTIGRHLHDGEYLDRQSSLSWRNAFFLYCVLIAVNIFLAFSGYAVYALWAKSTLFAVVAFIFFYGLFALFIANYDWFSFFVVTHNVSPFRGMRMSKAMSRGRKMQNLVLFMSVLLLNLVGLLCFGVGLVFTLPMSIVVYSYMFRKISMMASESHTEI